MLPDATRCLHACRGRQIALDVVRGLHHMHSRKVMHLDLKSANILLARDGTAKIADVGLAKILTRDNTCVSTEGTFDWAAPEACFLLCFGCMCTQPVGCCNVLGCYALSSPITSIKGALHWSAPEVRL